MPQMSGTEDIHTAELIADSLMKDPQMAITGSKFLRFAATLFLKSNK